MTAEETGRSYTTPWDTTKQAKSLLDAARSGDPEANERIRSHHPRLRGPLRLHVAQLVVAREYGFISWPRLRAHLSDPFQKPLREVDRLEADGHLEAGARVCERLFEMSEAPVAVRARATHRQGHLLADMGNPEEAVKAYARALALPGVPAEEIVMAYRCTGVLLAGQGRTPKAVEFYRKARSVPNAPHYLVAWSWFNEGKALERLGLLDDAVEAYVKAEAMPGAPAEVVSKAKLNRSLLLSDEDAERCWEEIDRMPDADPESLSKARYNLATRLWKTDKASFRKLLQKILDMREADPEPRSKALYEMGRLRMKDGQLEEAFRDWKEVHSMPDADPEPLSKARMMLALAGDFEDIPEDQLGWV